MEFPGGLKGVHMNRDRLFLGSCFSLISTSPVSTAFAAKAPQLAVGAHVQLRGKFKPAVDDPATGVDEGATLILRTNAHRCWFWFIPLPGVSQLP